MTDVYTHEQLLSCSMAANIAISPWTDDFRKSLNSLAVAVDPGLCQEPERKSETGESVSRESRKSFTASTSGSVSTYGGEIGSSSPRLSPDSKKTYDYSDLPPYVSKSKNAKFHKLFKSVPMEEYPIDTYSCAFKGDILLQGVMYISQNWICFYSKIRARGRLLEIPLEKVISITREKLALIIPNAIGIQMADQKYVFGSFMSRDNTYKMLITLLKHTQDSSDSASTKDNELVGCDNLASMAGRRSLSTESQDPEDVTHSADVSAESDSTDDNSDALPETAQSPSPAVIGRGPHCAEDNRIPDLPPDKVPGFFSWRCMDYRKMIVGLSAFTLKLQKVPRTNLLLAICIVLVVFLMLSAAGMTYKILLLQTRLEMSHLWSSTPHNTVRDQSDGSTYSGHWERQRATIHHLHDMMKANLQLLEQVHQSLKSLESCAAGKDRTPAK